MAIRDKGNTTYEGCVIRIYDHYWLDGMLEVYAVVWDMDTHDTRTITVGYYGSDGCNLCGGIEAEVDLSEDVKRDILRTIKKDAPKVFERSVIQAKEAIQAGTRVEVVRGRKVKKGTILDVFWVGEKLTYRGMMCGFEEYETLAGCHDMDGNKVWIRADYLKNIDPIKSPCASERKKFMKAYVRNRAEGMGVKYM